MASDAVQIPSRSLFRQPEVCEIAQVQPYVLRSWEAEFKDLGVAKTQGGPRVYRRADVERVLRIKHLLFVEGLTIAGARRRLQDEQAAPAPASGGAGRSAVERRARADPVGAPVAAGTVGDAGAAAEREPRGVRARGAGAEAEGRARGRDAGEVVEAESEVGRAEPCPAISPTCHPNADPPSRCRGDRCCT